VDISTGVYHCFVCDASGRLPEFKDPNQKEKVAQFLKNQKIGGGGEGEQETGKTTESSIKNQHPAKAKKTPDPKTYALLVERMRYAQRRLGIGEGRQYLLSRGISLETANAAGLGYEPYFRFLVPAKDGNSSSNNRLKFNAEIQPAILFPLYNPEGKFLSYYARATCKERLHFIPPGPKGVFNAQAFARAYRNQSPSLLPLILVEGAFDALTMIQSGYPNVAALIGTSLLNLDWYKKLTNVVLSFDQDDVGQAAQRKAYHQLSLMGLQCRVMPSDFYQGHKDFASFYKEQNDTSISPGHLTFNWKLLLGITEKL
jgi:DNA primase